MSRAVKLKPEKPATSPAVRLSRGENGLAFLVGVVGKDGIEDFRSQAEFANFDEALKDAEARAHRLRIPLRNDTGVEPDQAPTVRTSGQKAVKRAPAPAMPTQDDDEPASLADHFKLPELGDRLSDVDLEVLEERASAMHRRSRDEYLSVHSQIYGGSRDHSVAYTQKVHDQIQGQLHRLFVTCSVLQALVYAYLENAFERIERLESAGRGLSYAGVWKPGKFQRGQFVTFQGSLWHCERTTEQKPGESDDFTLAVKRGRDGKDAKQ